MATPINTLAEMLVQYNLVSPEVLPKIQAQADYFGQTLFQYIAQHRIVSAEKLCDACVDFFHVPKISIEHIPTPTFAVDNFPPHILKNHLILPIHKQGNTLTVAIANPNDIEISKSLAFQMGLTVHLHFARYDVLYRIHNMIISEQRYSDLHSDDNLPQLVTHQLLSDAIHRGASDIHFEPYQHYFRVRFRMDGLLHTIIQLPIELTDAILSRIKVLAHMDIAIKRMPQDGRLGFVTTLGFFKDCRVSTCPTIHGEKIVIRLLDANTQIKPIDELGLTAKNRDIILKTIEQPHGLILVTGPTGSGKTITLYTLLHILNQQHRNIITIEDPVEMQLEGVNQTHVNAKTGLTFSHTLRTVLRQDPDVIMIGEIRDQETAEMAIRAALTGHLVFATLHTNSASEAITRLCHIGIAPFHLISALTLIIAQRLVRKLCALCKTGCTHCTNGYQGRTGIFELMPITESLKTMIVNNESHIALRNHNLTLGHLPLWESALEAVNQGITSLAEIYRVVPNYTNETI
jgi:type IV pilus assembly protein PilB